MRTSMNPPPPILPAAGSTTARANAVATAASTALPPRSRISTPARDASSSSVATIPWAPRTASLRQLFSESARAWYSAASWARAAGRKVNVSSKKLAESETADRRFMDSKNSCLRLRLALGKEFHSVRAWEDSCPGSAGDEFLHGLFPFFPVAEGPFVYVHAHELVGQFGFHVARELHGVFQRVFAMVKAVRNAVADGF